MVVDRPRNILVAYDGSDSARRALDRAAALSGYGSVLTVVSADGPEALAEARERLLSRQVAALYVERAGEAGEALIEKARELEADLVVIGRRSGSADVIREAPCDVLVVR